MDQVALTIFGFDLYWYGVMLATAFIAGLANATWVGKRTGRTFPLFSDLLFWLVVGGIAGARIAYVAANWSEFQYDPLKILNLRGGGLVFYGGLVGGILAFIMFTRQRHERLWALGDIMVTSLPLGHLFGRIGCFMQGCCHGTITNSSLGVHYPKGSMVWNEQFAAGKITENDLASLPVHPVQLYEAAANLLIWVALILFYRRPHRDGRVVGLYLVLYSIVRFSLEFFRGDERIRTLAHLSLAQMTSVVALGAGIAIWFLAGRAAPQQAQPPRQEGA